MNIRHASVIVFYDKDGKVLLQERGSHSKLGEEWGFFGGKIEEGETPKQAIKREINEELNYDLKEFEFLGKFEYPPFKDWLITVEIFLAPLPPQKDLKVREGKSAKLFDIRKTNELKMVSGDHIVLKAVENYLIKNDKISYFDAILVLGELLKPDGSISDNLRKRLDKSVELINESCSHQIIVSGGYGFLAPYKPSITEAKAMKEYLVKIHGAPEDRILMEEESKDTIGNAYFVKSKYLEPNEWNKILIVTSDFHTERVKYVFRKVLGPQYLFDIVGVESDASDKELEMEKKIIGFIKKYLEDVEDGDNEAIKKLLFDRHPAYAKKPDMTKEQLLEMMKR
ncbi:MAG: YdcF family protein [Nanoarchaeota archaeon]|nr:YdcF family protein [Nanoarchaeota archaeon]